MLNKNRMMVFKNKGKDQEVSEMSLPLGGKVTEPRARRRLSVEESRRFHTRRLARCHFFSSELVHEFMRVSCSAFLPISPCPFSLRTYFPFILFLIPSSFILSFSSSFIFLFLLLLSFLLLFFSTVSCLLSCSICCFFLIIYWTYITHYLIIKITIMCTYCIIMI